MVEHVKAEISDLYALGAVDGEEKRAIEGHIRECEPCAENIAWAHQRIALVGLSLAPARPSAAAREMVMRRLPGEGVVKRTEAPPVRIPEAPAAVPAPAVRHETKAEPQPSPKRIAEPEAAEKSGSPAGWIVAALILVVAAGVCWTGWRHVQVLTRQAAVQQGQIAALRHQLETARSRLQLSAEPSEHLLAASGTVRLVLTGSAGHAGVLYNPRSGTAVCSAQVTAPPAGKAYQLWLVSTLGTPMSMGLLSAADPATATGQIKPGIEASAFIVTVEPQGGSPSPSGPRVLTGGDY